MRMLCTHVPGLQKLGGDFGGFGEDHSGHARVFEDIGGDLGDSAEIEAKRPWLAGEAITGWSEDRRRLLKADEVVELPWG